MSVNKEILSNLKEIVGDELFNKIVDSFGGFQITIPTRLTIQRENQKKEIEKLHKSGMNVLEICTLYPDISSSTIYRWIK